MKLFMEEIPDPLYKEPLYEKFLDYYSGTTHFGGRVQLFIYENPTRDEWIKFIAQDSRGWISTEGNLYMEGYEDRASITQIIHEDLLKVLAEKGLCTNTFASYYYMDKKLLYDIANNGILVQRQGVSRNLYMAETYMPVPLRKKSREIEELFDLCAKMNPYVHLVLQSYNNPAYAYPNIKDY